MNTESNQLEQRLVDMFHDEISAEEREALMALLQHDPDARLEWEAIQQTRLEPDLDIVFEHKNILLRETKKAGLRPLFKYVIGMAAILGALAMGTIFYWNRKVETPHVSVQSTPVPKDTPTATIAPLPEKATVAQNQVQQLPVKPEPVWPSKPTASRSGKAHQQGYTPNTEIAVDRNAQPNIPEKNVPIEQDLQKKVSQQTEETMMENTIVAEKIEKDSLSDSGNAITFGPIPQMVEPKNTLVIDGEKGSGVLRVMNKVNQVFQKIRKGKNALLQKEIVVTLGDRTLISLNH
jgi:hypothetical protein